MPAISAHELVKHFAPDIRAVDGIDLDIPEGQIFGFLGQNGSGKTTTVRMLATLIKPTSGTATVDGIDIARDPAAIRRRVGVALQEVGLDELQTGRELLTLQARLFGIDAKAAMRRVSNLLEVVTLSDAADRPLSGYSGGMKRRLDSRARSSTSRASSSSMNRPPAWTRSPAMPSGSMSSNSTRNAESPFS